MLAHSLTAEERRAIASEVIRASGSLDTVAKRRGLERHTVAAIARNHGWPDLQLMKTRLIAPQFSELVARAEQLGLSSELAVFRDAVTMLAQAVEAAEEVESERRRQVEAREAKRAEVEQMRARLEKAERELEQLDQNPAEQRKLSKTAENALIRAWAASAGMDCPSRGRIPQQVREAFEEANR